MGEAAAHVDLAGMDDETSHQELAGFLERSFNPEELRKFLSLLPDGAVLANELPVAPPSFSAMVRVAVGLLRDRGDVREPTFYHALVRERRLLVDAVVRCVPPGVDVGWPRKCVEWRKQGEEDLARRVRAWLVRTGSSQSPPELREAELEVAEIEAGQRPPVVAGLAAVERGGTGIMLPPRGSALGERVPGLDWVEQYRLDIGDLVMGLEGVLAVMLLSDLAMCCDMRDRAIASLVARMKQWYRLHADRTLDYTSMMSQQALLREVLEATDVLIANYRRRVAQLHTPIGAAPAAEAAREAVYVAGVGLAKAYGGRAAVLREIALSIAPGTIVGVVGPNSSGKSTLLDILRGELLHSAGELTFPGLAAQARAGESTWRAIRRQIRHVPQRPPRWPGRMIDDLRVWAAHLGYTGAANDTQVEYIVERLGLELLEGERHHDKTWDALSGGYRMRFELARARIGEPMLLVLDEPLAPLDARAQHSVLETLRAFTRLRWRPSVVLSAQNVVEIEAHVDLLVSLHADGRAIYIGPPRGIGVGSTHHVLEVSLPIPERVVTAIRGIAGCGLQVRHGVALITVPIAADSDYAAILALLRVGVEIDSVRDITRSVRRLFWGGLDASP